MSSPTKRRENDIMKLMMSDFQVELDNDSLSEFYVTFKGPKESNYEGGTWKIRVELPEAYPYKSPSIGFKNKIYHPNVDENAGSVCLDVINQTWTPMYDLLNVFDQFLPQLLLYPNASDPLNGEAASLLLRNKEEYDRRVKEYVRLYAKDSAIRNLDKGKQDQEMGDNDEEDENDGFLPDSDEEEDEEKPASGAIDIPKPSRN